MKSSPRYLHRFYTDESTFTHVDPGVGGQDAQAFTVNNQKVPSTAITPAFEFNSQPSKLELALQQSTLQARVGTAGFLIFDTALFW